MASKKRDGLYKRGGIWWARTDPLTDKPKSTGCRDLEAAKRWRAHRERIAADPSYRDSQTAKASEWMSRLVVSLQKSGKSEAYIGIVKQKLGHWVRIMGEDAMLSEYTTDAADTFMHQRRDEGVIDYTIGKEFACMVRVLKLAKRGGAYAGDLETFRPPDLVARYVPKKRVLTRQELTRLLAQLEPRRAAFVAVCVALGCRLSEAFKLLPTDVDLESGRVHIGGTKTAESNRMVPILSLYRPLLVAARPYLPLDPWGNLLRDMKSACRRAGIAPCSPNDLRRTHATLLKEAGVDSDTVRRLLGHTTTTLVDRVYGQPSTEALAGLAEQKLLTAAPLLRDATFTLQSPPEESESRRAPRDSNTRPSAPECEHSLSDNPRQQAFSAGSARLAAASTWVTGVPDGTTTLQRLALGYAAQSMGVLRVA